MRKNDFITPVMHIAIIISRHDGLWIKDLCRLTGLSRSTVSKRVERLIANNIIYRDSGMRCYVSPHAKQWVANFAAMPEIFPEPPPPPQTSKQGTYVYTEKELREIKRHMAPQASYK